MTSFCSILEETASEIPEKPLFVFAETRWRSAEQLTYGELGSRSLSVAKTLFEFSDRGDRALLLFPAGPAFWEAFFGCLVAGVIAVPLHIPNLNRKSDLLAGVCRECVPSVLMTDSKTAELLHRRADRHPYLSGIPVTTPDDWRNTPACFPRKKCDENTTAFLQYTSGSTSRPKGVQISHANLLFNLRLIYERMQLRRLEDRAVTWLPHYHDMGLVGSYLGAFFAGITSWCLPPEEFVLNPGHWLQLISENQAGVCGCPDFGYRHCVKKISEDELEAIDLSSWRVAYIGAEKIRAETLTRFSQKFRSCGFQYRSFFPCYGLGETTLMVTGGPAEASPVIRHVSTSGLSRQRIATPEAAHDQTILVGCGQIITESQIAILEPERHTVLENDQIGEILVAGPSVTCGYVSGHELNAAHFCHLTIDGERHQFFRTGDLGFLSGSELFIVGRNSEMMIVRGRNLYPEDIEECTSAAHDDLAPDGCIAFSVEFDGQEELVVVAELRRSVLDSESFAGVLAAIRQELSAGFGINPVEILLVRPATLPRTTSGKLRRMSLRDSYQRGTLTDVTDGRS